MKALPMTSSMKFAFSVSLGLHAAILMGFELVAHETIPPVPRGDGRHVLTLILDRTSGISHPVPPESSSETDSERPVVPVSSRNQPAALKPPSQAAAEPTPRREPNKQVKLPDKEPPDTADETLSELAVPEPAQESKTVEPHFPPPSPPATRRAEHGNATLKTRASVGLRVASYHRNPAPGYPLAARRRHQQGLVLLSVGVTAGGKVASVRIKQSSGFPLLDSAALKAVKQWEFEPARIGSVRVQSKIEVPVQFRLVR